MRKFSGELLNGLERILTAPFTEWTKHDYKRSVKKFFKWLGKEELVSWIKCTPPRNRKLPEEILTEEDIKKMIDTVRNARTGL